VVALAGVVPVPAGAAPGARCATYTQRIGYVPPQVTRMDPQRVWPLSRGAGVAVAVLDSGVNGTHPQLAGRVLPGIDLVRGSGTADTDCNGHGSIVGGVIAGHESADSGFTGMAPDATLLPIRIADDTAEFQGGSSRIATAIRYAVDHGASVVNMSLTTPDSADLRSAVAYAHRHGVVMVAAAGNENRDTGGPSYPAAYPDVIAVAGVDRNDEHVDTSVTGSWVDLAAPGTKIIGPAADSDGYSQATGTSFAAPFVSGTVALLRAYRPELSPDQIEHRLTATADHPAGGRNTQVGYGVVNPYRALTTVLGHATGTRGAAALPAPAPAAGHADPTRTRAFWLAGSAAVLTLLLLAALAVVPRGRRRHWRPTFR
jgi:membrane-anchored mycosin MYCP